jgi:hypothetical protein
VRHRGSFFYFISLELLQQLDRTGFAACRKRLDATGRIRRDRTQQIACLIGHPGIKRQLGGATGWHKKAK